MLPVSAAEGGRIIQTHIAGWSADIVTSLCIILQLCFSLNMLDEIILQNQDYKIFVRITNWIIKVNESAEKFESVVLF